VPADRRLGVDLPVPADRMLGVDLPVPADRNLHGVRFEFVYRPRGSYNDTAIQAFRRGRETRAERALRLNRLRGVRHS